MISRKRLFEIIEVSGKKDKVGRFYDTFLITVVTISLIPLMFKERTPFLFLIDKATLLVLIFDYLFRVTTADYFLKKKSIWAFILYPFTPTALMNLLAILSTFSSLRRIFGVFRVFRLFRITKLLQYSRSVAFVLSVFNGEKKTLLMVVFLACVYAFTSAMFMFTVEPGIFHNFFEAVYWSTITLTTVGYGDFYPETTVGRIVTMASAMFGIAIIALPTVIFTAGFMKQASKPAKGIRKKRIKKTKVQKRKRRILKFH